MRNFLRRLHTETRRHREHKGSSKFNFFYFAIILFSFLFISCPDVYDPFKYNNIPPGMGSFTLSLSSSRTILPDTPSLTEFNSYTFIFTATANGENLTITGLTNSTYTNAINLVPGTYTLTVTALKDIGGELQPSAQGTTPGIIIQPSQNTPGSVTLYALPLLPASGVGNFTWNITFPNTVTSATLAIRDSSGVVQGSVETLTSGTLGNRTGLTSGIYTVTITMTIPGLPSGKTLVWHEILHIYATLTSHFPKTFIESNFNDSVHTVTFYNNYPSGGSTQQSVIHGYSFNNSPTNPTLPTPSRLSDAYLYRNINLPPTTSDIGWTIANWNTNAQGTGSVWNFATTPIHQNINLYANWTGPINVPAATAGNNDFEKAVSYTKANPNAYTIYVRNSETIAPQTMNVSNVDLTIQGITGSEEITGAGTGALFTVGGGGISGNRLTIRNISVDGEIFVFNLVPFTLEGTANVNEITLVASASENSLIEFSNWNGNIGTLNLFGLQASLEGSSGVISNWEDRNVLTGAGLTALIVNDINGKLGNFYATNNGFNKTDFQLINNTHVIVFESGTPNRGVLKETEKDPQNVTNLILSDDTKTYGDTSTAVTVEYDTGFDTTNSGAITIYYTGTGTTIYPESTTPPVNAGTYDVSVSTAGGTVYAPLGKTLIGTLTIAPRQLSINTPAGSPTKVYDGTTTYTGSGITLGTIINIVGTDDVTATITSATYNSADAATANQITIVYGITGAAAANYIAPVNGTIAGTITKASGAAVSGAPTANGLPTHNTIVINPVTIPTNPGSQIVEYAISTENNADPSTLTWQDGTMFTGLTRDTTYYVYTRSAENSNYNAGAVQVSAGIKTDEKERITDTADILDFIDRQQSAGTIDDPITLPFRLQLTETNWLEILEAIQTSGKFVDVDLGDTTRSTSATGGGLRSNGTFDPMSANNTGKGYIVNIDLPDASTSVQGGTWENPTFNHFDNLKSVSGNELTSVAVFAFRDCSSLENINFPNVTTINASAFEDCISLVNVHFPRVTSINGFRRCINLESVSFPLATSINFFAFSDCTSLIDVDIPNVTIIGTGAFQNCTSLENVFFPQLETIQNAVFEGCTSLVSVNIPNITRIEGSSFNNTGNHILTIILGFNAPTLGQTIFSNVIRTVNVLVPSNATGYGSIPGVYDSLDNITENWGNGLRGRGWWEGAFSGSGPIRNGITVNIDYE